MERKFGAQAHPHPFLAACDQIVGRELDRLVRHGSPSNKRDQNLILYLVKDQENYLELEFGLQPPIMSPLANVNP
jgi:hypothetical protein